MPALDVKEIAVRLIQDDLVNSKFMYCLEKIELVPSAYYLNIGETVVMVMGFSLQEHDKIYEKYSAMKAQNLKKKFTGHSKKVKEMALSIYQKLSGLKQQGKRL